MKHWILWFSFFWVLAPSASALDLLVTGDIAGEIRPCGCSVEGQRGGIERLSAYLKQKQNRKKLWVDLGNYSVEPSPQGLLKNGLYHRLFKENHLFAVLPGPKEFLTGKRGIAKWRNPYLLTNRGEVLAYTERVKYRKGWQFFGFLSPKMLDSGSRRSGILEGVSPFIERVRKLKTKERKAVLLFRGSLEELRQVEKTRLFDRVILANLATDEKKQVLEAKIGAKTYFSPPLQGQGVLEYNLEGNQGETHWLGPNSPLDRAWEKPFATYDKQVENLFFRFVATENKKGDKRVYKGSAYCVNCHVKQGEVWSKSKHAHAFASLEKESRQYDPDCVVCHTQGFKKGGFLSKELSSGLENVGCENCHGLVAENHGVDPEYKKNRVRVTAKTCQTCHRGNHSPKFNFDTYFPKIKH